MESGIGSIKYAQAIEKMLEGEKIMRVIFIQMTTNDDLKC